MVELSHPPAAPGLLFRACAVDDVPLGEGRTVAFAAHRIAVFNTVLGWRATDADCPHAAGPLADGILADASVTCPLHQRRFALATGEPIGHDCAALTAHRVELRGPDVFVQLADSVPSDKEPTPADPTPQRIATQ
jgi:nitrite reductase (NADH) small subunit